MEHERIYKVRYRGRHPDLGIRTTWITATDTGVCDQVALREQGTLKLAFLNPAGGGPNKWSTVNVAAFCSCRAFHHIHE